MGCAGAHARQPGENKHIDESRPQGSVSTLLDVAILEFVPATEDGGTDEFMHIRAAEAKLLPYKLKSKMLAQNAWASVKLVPSDFGTIDLLISGRIVVSDPENLEIAVLVRDASGEKWIDGSYAKKADPKVYDDLQLSSQGPFHHLYSEIANDIKAVLRLRTSGQLLRIKTISELRFAQFFDNDVFGGYLQEGSGGTFSPRRLPAQDDPNLRRIRKIRDRNDLFTDVLQIEYEVFANNLDAPYYQWQKESFVEKRIYRSTLAQSRSRLFEGAVEAFRSLNPLTTFRLIAKPSAPIGIGYATKQIESGLELRHDVKMRQEGLRELTASLNNFVRSHNISIDDRTVSLTGSVDERYKQFRRILREFYEIETSEN